MKKEKNIEEYLFREANLDDLSTLVLQRRLMFVEVSNATNQKALNDMDKAYEKYIKNALTEGAFKAWVVEINGAIVAGGAISIYKQPPRPQDDSLRYVYVHSVYTDPKHRRRGLARRILETIINWCRENNLKTLTLHAVEASRPLYVSLGFTPTTEMRMFL